LSKSGKEDCLPNHTTAETGIAGLERLAVGSLYGHPTTWHNVSTALLHRPSVHCQLLPMNRFGAVQVGAVFELLLGSLIIISTWSLIFAYLFAPGPALGKNDTKSLEEKIKEQEAQVQKSSHDKNTLQKLKSNKAKMPTTWSRKTNEMPSRFFAFFILGPNAGAGFSSLIFLSWISPKMFNALFSRGEGLLWGKMWYLSMISPRVDASVGKLEQEAQNAAKKEEEEAVQMHGDMIENMSNSKSIGERLIILMCMAMYFGLVFFSLQQILIKLTMIDFSQKADFYTWTLNEWVGFLGFVNQMVGCFSFYPSTMAHLFVFVFGSYNAKLNHKQCDTASWYLRLIAMKCQSGKILQTGKRTAVVTVLAGLNAESFQQLLQSQRADDKVNSAQARRKETYKIMNGMEGDGNEELGTEFSKTLGDALKKRAQWKEQGLAQIFHDEHLEQGIRRRISALEKERDRLVDQARSAKVPRSGDEGSGSALLNLAAEVQNFIEDLKEMQMQGDAVFSDTSSEEETEGEETGSDGEGSDSEMAPLRRSEA